ncbi:MAG: glutamate--cysteine ligase [Cycloclasticus sp. symbiont of Poecilosclerida sp. M]|nr:MAG: glutamate--cysteine ligase [Cycloclasticus sp. symbiont of Poecilosclerida sp. M]
MSSLIRERLTRLATSQQEYTICAGLRGLEKESLRVTPNGKISQKPHPKGLGSALTNPYITTDYSEALLEFITPPLVSNADALSFMHDLHSFTYKHLGDELLWSGSMPCIVDGDMSVPIANYGDSNIGLMKHIYRVGLWHRYGRSMQAIAGIHFNYSLPDKFWPIYQQQENDTQPLEDFISQSYFDMTRNLHRNGWLLLFLFGSSPAICKSFVAGKEHAFNVFDEGTLFEKYATSLRMSDIGYKNDSQSNIAISYNSLDAYVSGLTQATQKSHPEYATIGTKGADGQYAQLNTNILQIENEYYSNVRPKQIAASGERPSTALRERGVRYVELRSVDLSIVDPSGLNESQLNFLEAFMIYCLLSESPPLSTADKILLDDNISLVATNGRRPNLLLNQDGKSSSLNSWGLAICNEMVPICNILDTELEEKPYSSALEVQVQKLNNPNLTPSSIQLKVLKEEQLPFFKYVMQQSNLHKTYFENRPLSNAKLSLFDNACLQSIQQQNAIELSDTLGFDQFLTKYFSQN